MATLKDTKRRITSVKSTQKITRAMKLVSSAKYARANRLVMAARPYGEAFARMVARLVGGEAVESPLLVQRPEAKALVIVLATDRGLCGGLNANLFKRAELFLREKKQAGVDCHLLLWGRRAILYGQKSKRTIFDRREKVLDKPSYEFVAEVTTKLCEQFKNGDFDRIYIAYAKFKNAMTQTPTLEQLLPVVGAPPPTEEGGVVSEQGPQTTDYIFEPAREELLASLLHKQLSAKIYGLILEGSASEHAARMTAMDNATSNADAVIRRLTLEYNRARQAAITKELIEITSGAEAL